VVIYSCLRATMCGGESHLKVLLVDTCSVFLEYGITYWLDYGTLLGAIRERGILGWEYDNDMGMEEAMCEKASSPEVRAAFKSKGYTLYNRSDYIAQKVKMTWDDQTRRVGYSSGYMSTPCLRVYDASLKYFVDIYWYKSISAEQVRAAPEGSLRLPNGYTGSNAGYDGEDLICNAEGLEQSEFFPGGCRAVSKVLPVTYTDMFNQKMSVPADSEYNLEEMYGAGWRTPKGKGVNGVVCLGHLRSVRGNHKNLLLAFTLGDFPTTSTA